MDRSSRTCGACMLLAGLWILLVAGGAPAAERLHLGMPVEPPNLVHITPWLAQELGYFKDEGLEVKITGFRGGPATHQALVGSGSDLDMGDIPGPLLFIGSSKGSKMRAFYSFASKNEALLVAAPDIKSLKEVKGKKVAIEGIGGYSHLGFLSVAEPAGITDKDVTYVRATPPQRLPFLLQGNVDAVVTHVEEFFRAQREKPVNELGRLWRAQPHYLYAAIAASEDRLKERHEAFAKFVRACIRANRFLYKNKEKTLEVAEKYTKQPRWALDKAYDLMVEERIFSVNGGLPAQTIAWTNDFNAKLKEYDGPKPDPAKLVDMSIAQEALKGLGGPMGPPFDPEN